MFRLGLVNFVTIMPADKFKMFIMGPEE